MSLMQAMYGIHAAPVTFAGLKKVKPEKAENCPAPVSQPLALTLAPPVDARVQSGPLKSLLQKFRGMASADSRTPSPFVQSQRQTHPVKTFLTRAGLAVAGFAAMGPSVAQAPAAQNLVSAPSIAIPPDAKSQAIFKKMQDALAQGKSPLEVTTQEERNKIACFDDGVRPAEPTFKDKTAQANYLSERTARIDQLSAIPRKPVTKPALIPTPMTEGTLGSGSICTPDGVVITSRHVVAEAIQSNQKLQVQLEDGSIYDAEPIGSGDKERDVAAVRLLGKDGKPLHFPKTVHLVPNSDTIRKGEFVASAGNARGLNRAYKSGEVTFPNRLTEDSIQMMHQVDIPITHGDSGSMVATADSSMLGVTDAIIEGNGSLDFVVPANAMANYLALERLNMPTGAQTGTGIMYITANYSQLPRFMENDRQSLEMYRQEVAFIKKELARLKKGPVTIPQEVIDDLNKLLPNLLKNKPVKYRMGMYKSELEDRYKRSQEEIKSLSAKIKENEAIYKKAEKNMSAHPGLDGVVMLKVEKGKLADQAGLKPGAVIVALDGKPVKADEFRSRLVNHYAWEKIEVTYVDDGKIQKTVINPDGLKKALAEREQNAKKLAQAKP